MSKTFLAAALCLVATGPVALSVSAQVGPPAAAAAETYTSSRGSGEFGLKFGILGDGDIKYVRQGSSGSPSRFTTESSYSGGAFFSQRLYHRLHWTVELDIHYLQKWGSGEAGLDAGAGLKYRWTDPSGVVSIRPAALLGFGLLPDIWYFTSSRYATFKVLLELAFLTRKGTGLLLEVGSLKTLSGGDDTYDIDAGPMTLVRGGIIF